MTMSPAAALTKSASKQTYYTILFLADRGRMEDAYRAYAYFRWLDDVVDANSGTRSEREAFLEGQKALLEQCYRGEPPRRTSLQEKMLVDLIKHDQEEASGLQCYLRNMMLVMDFDAERRGRLISEAELRQYTGWLARAVTEAMHYFIGRSCYAPEDDTRYLAVSGAHITHMLRDMFEDMQTGYFNIPREALPADSNGLPEIHGDAFRSWVKSRVDLARRCFAAGRIYLSRVESRRCRLAGSAYFARFEWLLETIEREGYVLRPRYNDGFRAGSGLRMGWMALAAMINARGMGAFVDQSPGNG